MMGFAAANAAATTRLSAGNEEVLRNVTTENSEHKGFHAFFLKKKGYGGRRRSFGDVLHCEFVEC